MLLKNERNLYKKTAVFFIIIILFFLTSCETKVSFQQGNNILTTVINNLKSKDCLNQNFNYSYDRTEKEYHPIDKRFLTTLEATKSFSFYMDGERSTSVDYLYKKTYNIENSVINADKYIYGKADLTYYVFNEKLLRNKTDGVTSESTWQKKHILDNFYDTINNLNKQNYYYNIIEEILAVWSENGTFKLTETDSIKFSKDKDDYTLNAKLISTSENIKTDKELTIKFDNTNIYNISSTVKTFETSGKQLSYSKKKLIFVLNSGMADIPSELDNYENY